MAPAVIADSDGDESEAGSPLSDPSACPSPPNEDVEAQVPSENITHPSTSMSTSPGFFNGIFEDQNDAAKQEGIAAIALKRNLPEEAEAAEAISFDEGFVRTTKRESVTRADKSPWDVPSSPEMAKPKRLRRLDSSYTTTKITRGVRRRLEDIGYQSQEDEPSFWGRGMTQGATRRGQAALCMEPPSDDMVSTLPFEDDASVMGPSPTNRSDSQKEHHSAVQPGLHGSPAQPPPRRNISIRSGEAKTNISKARPDSALSIETTSPGLANSRKSKLSKQSPSPAPSSNLSLPPCLNTKHELRGGEAAQQIPRTAGDGNCPVQSDDNGAGGIEGGKDADVETQTKPALSETKRPRGRPKKTGNSNSSKEGETIDSKAKRKRGRPKKSDEGKEGRVDAADDEETAPRIRDSTPPAPSNEQQEEVNGSNAMLLLPARDTMPAAAAAEERPTAASRMLEAPSSSSTEIPVLGHGKDKASKTLGRAIYRVGLSKKTRIAPLLKVIRK
ncbi:uncharacterized protein UV8b_00740 [Ustilaginoidea virens]|uniref:AT hook domain-containing protein n=1 Tax=Ustilaginoidea virens TaxID=1159556 RepID=A0A8E5HK92_USTVR|nr:uncharacterized protein UV8b_00740 [Ustilaginoidea virens]QUC16499.1 hypothetical protein UV8b_00740 [Ustilaginoidea virens]